MRIAAPCCHTSFIPRKECIAPQYLQRPCSLVRANKRAPSKNRSAVAHKKRRHCSLASLHSRTASTSVYSVYCFAPWAMLSVSWYHQLGNNSACGRLKTSPHLTEVVRLRQPPTVPRVAAGSVPWAGLRNARAHIAAPRSGWHS